MSRWMLLQSEDEAGAMPVPAWPPKAPYAPSPPEPKATHTQPGDPESGCWSSEGDYVVGLTFLLPTKPDRNYRRGNFQLRVPGFAHGYNDKDRSIVMTWELPSFVDADQDFIIAHYKSLGLTHILLSVPQARNQSVLYRLPECANRCHEAGLLVVMAALGGDQEKWQEVIDILAQMEGMLSELCVAWQIDKGDKRDEYGRPYTQVIPDLILQVSEYAKAHGLLVSVHWINGACALWPYPSFNINNRFDFGRWAADYVDCQYYQTDVDAAIDDTQSGAAKVLEGLYGPTRLCAAEFEVQAQADNPHSGREPYARLKGYLLAAARRGSRVMDGGYFDQTCHPSGEVL